MGKLAFVFAGQGAQTVGMGKELAENFPIADKTFDEASEALGFDIKDMIWNGDSETLMITENTQPTIVTMSVAALRVLQEKGIKPDVVAGLSLGEYTAHIASGSMEFADGVRLVKKRGKYMEMDTYWTQISDLEDKSILQFITGAKSLDEWDQFCTDWHVQGGDQILELVKDYLAE